MSKFHLNKILKMINNNEHEYDIRRFISNKMDVGQITEDEALVIDIAIQQRTDKLIERLTEYTK